MAISVIRWRVMRIVRTVCLSLYCRSMRNPLVQYLVGAFILGIGLIILLSSANIAQGLAHF